MALNRLTVDGAEYAWEYRHGWFVDWGKDLKAISVSVALNPGRTRELILDFSFQGFGPERNPSHSKVRRAVEGAIPLAIQAGWEPESRGKAFRYEVSEAGAAQQVAAAVEVRAPPNRRRRPRG